MANTVSTTLSDDTLNRIIQIESAGKLHAKAATSSATGLGQFLNATWLDTLKKHRPDLFNGAPFNDELALRTDPKIAVEMLARFTEDNASALGAGYTDGDLYLAHFLGLATARRFFRAAPDTSAETLAGARAVAANRSILAGKTAGQVRAWAQRSMETKWEKAGRPNWVAQYYGGKPTAKAPAPLPVPPVVPQTKQDAKEGGWLAGVVAAITGAMYAAWGNGAFRIAVYVLIAAAVYWLIARPIIRRVWALDDVDADAGTKLRLALKGVKTKLWSWFLGIAGVALSVLSAVEGIDISAFLPDLFGIPGHVWGWALLSVVGWITLKLRQATTTPVGTTDLALAPSIVPDPEPLPPAEEIVKKVRHKRQPKKAKKAKKKKAKA